MENKVKVFPGENDNISEDEPKKKVKLMAKLYITVIVNNRDGRHVHVRRKPNGKLDTYDNLPAAFMKGLDFKDEISSSLGYDCEVCVKIERLCSEYVAES